MSTNETIQRKIWVGADLKADIKRYWRVNPQYDSESDLLRSVLEDIARAPINEETQLAGIDAPGKESVRVWVDPETWDLAQTRAAALGLSLHSVIRRRFIRMMTMAVTQHEDGAGTP